LSLGVKADRLSARQEVLLDSLQRLRIQIQEHTSWREALRCAEKESVCTKEGTNSPQKALNVTTTSGSYNPSSVFCFLCSMWLRRHAMPARNWP
jgi:hypothetical protein